MDGECHPKRLYRISARYLRLRLGPNDGAEVVELNGERVGTVHRTRTTSVWNGCPQDRSPGYVRNRIVGSPSEPRVPASR